MAVLEVQSVPGGSRIEVLSGSRTMIGRHRRCAVVFDDSSVSRNHACLVAEGGDYWIEDLGSRNGTMVNGDRIGDRRRLADQDVITIEQHRMVFRVAHPHPVLDRPSSVAGSLTFGAVAPGHSNSRAQQKLDAIMAISANLSRSLGLDHVLGSLLETLLQVFPNADCGSILLPDATGEPMVRTWRSRTDDSESQRFVASRTIARRVMESGESLLCMDVLGDQNLSTQQSIHDSQIRSVMCSPMTGSDGVARGVIHLDRRDIRQPFAMEDLELLACVSIMAGQAVETSQLHSDHLKAELQEQELQLAGEVQRLLLPAAPLEIPGFELAHFYQAASDLGGDFFDYVQLPDGKIAIAIADVAGKGPSAALLVACLSSALRATLMAGLDCAATVERLGRVLENTQSTGRFITFLLVILDPARRTLTMTSAGHVPPLVCRGDDLLDPLGDHFGCPLGIDTGLPFEQVAWPMQPGDTLLLMTDGVTEAHSPARELFGIDRTVLAWNNSDRSAAGGIQSILRAIKGFTADAAAYDDICLVALTCR